MYGFRRGVGGSGGGGNVTTTGSAVAGQVTLWNGPTSITGDAGLTYDAGTDTLTAGRTLVGLGSLAAPSIAFAGYPEDGFDHYDGLHAIEMNLNGQMVAFWYTSSVQFPQAYRLNWGTGLLGMPAAATMQLGLDSATPITQTIQGVNGVGADIGGGALVIRPGAGTGAATSSQLLLQTPEPHGSDSAAQTQTTRVTLDGVSLTTALAGYLGSKPKTLVSGTPTAFVEIAIADGEMIGGEIVYTAKGTDGTDRQSRSGRWRYSAVRKGATVTVGSGSEVGTQDVAVSAGTLTGTISCAAGTAKIVCSATFTSSLGSPVVTLDYRVDSTETNTVTPL